MNGEPINGRLSKELQWFKANDHPIDSSRDLTLALFVFRDGANDHDPAVAANHPALITHFFD